MDRAFRQIRKIASEPIPTDEFDIGAQATKIRRILEVIVNACLTIQMGIAPTDRLRIRFPKKNRADVLRDKVESVYYPSLWHGELGRPLIRIVPGMDRQEYLTKDRWFQVWSECGNYIHEERPGSTHPQPDYSSYPGRSRTWLQWIVNLLSNHVIVAARLDYIAHIQWPIKETGTLVIVQKRTTEFRARHDLANGDNLQVQMKDPSGKWNDVEDSSGIGVAMVELVGFYTATSHKLADSWTKGRNQ